ncbi:MAG: FecR family protein, partial [Pollutimonas bauzanensis]
MNRRLFLGGALAASFTGVMALRPPLGLWPSVLDLKADYRTARGEQRAVTLADGLTVRMNTQTRVNWDARQADAPAIELLAGEAEIDAARQVRIRAGSGLVQSGGARLNVRFLDDDTVCVTCLQGQADVRLARSYPLSPGRQLTYDPQGVLAEDSVDPVKVSAWRTGMLSFVDVPLGKVVDELNRYRPGRI